MGIPMYELDGEQALKSKLYDFRKQTNRSQPESFKKVFAKPETLSEDELKSLYVNYVAKEKELLTKHNEVLEQVRKHLVLPSEIQSCSKTQVLKRLPSTHDSR